MLRRKTWITAVLCCTALLLLAGCGRSEYRRNKAAYKENIIKAVIEAADNDDAEALAALFSSDLAERNSELRSEAQQFVEAVDGEFVSAEKKYGDETKTKSESSRYRTKIVEQYVVETTTGKYVIAFVDYPEVNSDEYQGLQSLGAQGFDDFENEACFAAAYDGIYVVTPDNHEEIKALREK